MKKISILILAVLLISGCTTIQYASKDSELSYGGSYICASYSGKGVLNIRLKNLDTGEKLKKRFTMKGRKYVQVGDLPPGRYTILRIYVTQRNATYSFNPMPYDLIQVMHINPGEIFYLGDFKRETAEGGGGSPVFKYACDTDWAFTSLHETYSFERPMEITSLEF